MKININKYENNPNNLKINRVYKKTRIYKNYTKNVLTTKKYSYWHGHDSSCPIGLSVIGRYLIHNIT